MSFVFLNGCHSIHQILKLLYVPLDLDFSRAYLGRDLAWYAMLN